MSYNIEGDVTSGATLQVLFTLTTLPYYVLIFKIYDNKFGADSRKGVIN